MLQQAYHSRSQSFEEMDTNHRLWVKMCVLLVWSALMLRALVLDVGADDVKTTDGANVVAYWERNLPGAIPSSIHAMVTPLSSQQATQLLLNITAMTRYFPNHAPTFCKAARIKCVQDIPSQKPTPIDVKQPSPKNLALLYHESAPFVHQSYHESDDPSSKNLDPFDDPSSKNLIPFYQSNHDPSSIMQNDASTKKPSTGSSQTLDTRISSKFTNVPRFLISPTVHEVRDAFREKQVLVTGEKIYVGLASDRCGGADERAFLPRKLARLFPFENEGSKIESMLEVSKESLVETIHTCEAQSKNDYLHAEVKACLTSLEDVVDFVTTIMGSSKPIKVYDSLFNASSVKFVGKTFTVLNVETLKQDPDEPSVSCHDMDFPFRVFYCHYAKQTKSFVATLQAEDGSVHDRIVNCHYDTSYWNPHHVAFRDLHTKPGEGEVCHWLGRTWMEENGWIFLHAT